MTIRLPNWDEQYHSKHGAIAEAKHVFIASGLEHLLASLPQIPTPLQVLEMGFGTGLNALLTFQFAMETELPVAYVGIEGYPIKSSEIPFLNYAEQLSVPAETFQAFHDCSWGEVHALRPFFHLEKRAQQFETLQEDNRYHLVYYDAFGPRVQPELWEVSVLERLYQALQPAGVLVTYCAKGSVRRNLEAIGFKVERLPGPPGKREMLRATKM